MQSIQETEVLIIGAGPAGLAVAGQLAQKKVPCLLIEKSDRIANSWYHHYDRLCLHTVKQYSHLPDHPFPSDYPMYVPKNLLIKYYQEYADKLKIKPRFNSGLKSLVRRGELWEVGLDNGSTIISRYVVLATGVNRKPSIPTWEGQDLFNGNIIHSREYMNPTNYIGKKTLVVGMGNTGAEVALDLCEQGVETYLSVRNEVLIVPRDVLGNPAQVTGRRLEKLPYGLGDWIGNITRKIVIGSLSRYGIRSNPRPPIVHLRETGTTPVIDLGTVKKIREGKIKVLPDIQSFYSEGIITVTGEKIQLDEVILATGYKADLQEFIKLDEKQCNKKGLPKECEANGEWEGLFFIGFDNYQLGGILGAIHRDALVISNSILQRLHK